MAIWAVSALVVMGVAGGLVFGFFGVKLRPFVPQNIVFVTNTLDHNEGQILFLHISPAKPNLTLINFDANLTVDVLGGFGEYPLRSVYPLLKSDQRPPIFIRSAMGQAMGLIVDEVWVIDEIPQLESPDQVKFFLSEVAIGKGSGRVGLSNRAWLGWLGSNTQVSDINILGASQSEDVEKAKAFFDYPSSTTRCAIAVINTTSIPGLGRKLSTIMEQSDLWVVRIDDADQDFPNSKVVLRPDADCLQTSKSVSHLLPSEESIQEDQGLSQEYRADVVVFLGEDLE